MMLTRTISILAGALALAVPGAAGASTGLSVDGAAPLHRDTLTVPMPCPRADCTTPPTDPDATAQGLRTVYLNFDGVTLKASSNGDDATTNTSFIISAVREDGQTLTIPTFNPGPSFSRQDVIDTVVAELEDIFAPYNVVFTTSRPGDGPYHMIVFGGDCPGVAGATCAGIAPMDCGDWIPSNIVFVFPGNLRLGDLAPTAAQELAHAFGLAHTTDNTDVMYPTIQSNFIPSSFGAGPIPDEACAGATYQDSHQEMMDTVGWRGQDTVGPSVQITAPPNGALVPPGEAVAADIADDNSVTAAELLINGSAVATKSSPPWTFTIPGDAAAGQTFVTVRATDDSGNRGEHRVSVRVLTGDEEPCVDGSCSEGFACVQDLCLADGGPTGELGATCETNEDCLSNACAESGGEQRCTQSCDAETACPEGFECLDGVACWPAPGEDGDDEGGCAITGDSRSALGGLGLCLVAVLVALGRRRR